MDHLKSKSVKVTAKMLKKKNKGMKKASHTADKPSESFCCPECKEPLVGIGAVRLRSRPQLTKHMQKLLRKRELNDQSLTPRQLELAERAMHQCNLLVMKCSHCQWQAEIQLENRESQHRRRARLQQKAEQERQLELVDAAEDSQPPNKKAQKKMKKKERRKKVAEAKAKDLQQIKRISVSPMTGAPEKGDDKPVSSTPRSSTPSSLLLSVESESPYLSSPCSRPGTLTSRTGKPLTAVTPQAARKPSAQTPQSAHRRPGSAGPGAGAHTRRLQVAGKQQLRSILNQQKKNSPSAKDSLSQFLNSLK